MMNKILVPFSYLNQINQVLPFSADLATQFQSELILLRILPPLRANWIPSGASLRKATVKTTELVLRQLEELSDPIRKMGIKVSIFTIEGKFHEETKHFAEIINASLIVLSERKRRGLYSKLFQSISSQVICKSDIPVIVVPEKLTKDNFVEKDKNMYRPNTEEREHSKFWFSRECFENKSSLSNIILKVPSLKNKATIIQCANCYKLIGSIKSY